MANEIKYEDYLKAVTIHHSEVDYNLLVPKGQKSADGKSTPIRQQALKLSSLDIYRILQPYITGRFMDQFKTVIPLAVYLIFFQIFILKQHVEQPWSIVAGLLAVVVGLMFFMEGLKLGLMPFAEGIGTGLPTKCRLPVVLSVTFLLGVLVTFAEPAVGALQAAGAIVSARDAPYLYGLLNRWPFILVLAVGIGVGIAAVLGTLRFLYGWSLKPLIYATLLPTAALTLYMNFDPELSKIAGLAWDCGAITTGPVTVPLVLALGIGVALAVGREETPLSGFGIVTLASILPVTTVLLTGIVFSWVVPLDSLNSASLQSAAAPVSVPGPLYTQTPYAEIIAGLRAVVPLVVFLILILKTVLKEQLKNKWIIAYGLVLALFGMCLFNIGLTYGLAKLGTQSGGLVTAAFMKIDAVQSSPLYIYGVGFVIAILFAWFLGFGATMAEPALNAMGATVENMTNGVFTKKFLLYSVSIGVGLGIALGVLKIILDIPLSWMLLPAYAVALVLTMFSSEEFVNIAWDSAGVTTGPVTVPMVLALGLGLGTSVKAVDGFGILALASIAPILSVLVTGLWVTFRESRISKEE